MKYDLGFGNSIAVRDAFLNTYNQKPITFNNRDLSNFNYPPHHGDPGLIGITAYVIERQIGLRYRHIFITNGATGSCVITMRAYSQMGYEYAITRRAPYYVRYPTMISASGLTHIQEDVMRDTPKTVALIDLPSNPLGIMDNIQTATPTPVILDGVYLNNVYMPPMLVQTVPHDVLVGSYSKLLGINGIRLGWIATNDDRLASRIGDLVVSEYCGLSTASQEILKSAIEDLNWDLFESQARFKMDNNREQWSQLEKFFGDTPVKNIGMFYYAPADQKCQELLAKSNIVWTKGSAMGTNDSFTRFNLGQGNQTIKNAVRSILKTDRIK